MFTGPNPLLLLAVLPAPLVVELSQSGERPDQYREPRRFETNSL
jgi:hypothetical protein